MISLEPTLSKIPEKEKDCRSLRSRYPQKSMGGAKRRRNGKPKIRKSNSGAGEGNRTLFLTLAMSYNNHYTTPAIIKAIYDKTSLSM